MCCCGRILKPSPQYTYWLLHMCNKEKFIYLSGMEYFDARRKPHNVGKVMVALVLITLCIFVLKQSPVFGGNSVVVWLYLSRMASSGSSGDLTAELPGGERAGAGGRMFQRRSLLLADGAAANITSVNGEKLMRVPYGAEKKFFRCSLFLVFCNRITRSMVSTLVLLLSKKSMDPVALIRKYCVVSFQTY